MSDDEATAGFKREIHGAMSSWSRNLDNNAHLIKHG